MNSRQDIVSIISSNSIVKEKAMHWIWNIYHSSSETEGVGSSKLPITIFIEWPYITLAPPGRGSSISIYLRKLLFTTRIILENSYRRWSRRSSSTTESHRPTQTRWWIVFRRRRRRVARGKVPAAGDDGFYFARGVRSRWSDKFIFSFTHNDLSHFLPAAT